jgi:hypothetical protein
MGVFANTAGVGLTYLTAIMTLVAGFPHFECLCPSGQIKLFCFGSPSPASSNACCHDRDHLATGPAKQHSSCCHRHEGKRGEVPSYPSAFQAAACRKVLTQAETFGLTSGKRAVREVTQASANPVSCPQGLLFPFPTCAPRSIVRSFFLLAPPTDLTVRLQRLLC